MNKEKLKSTLKSVYFSFFWLMIVLFIIDLVSKWIVQNNMIENQEIEIIPNFFSIVLIHNTGMAFGLGSNGDIGWRIFFICVSAGIGGGLLAYYIVKGKTFSTWMKVALAMMIAGAFGNLIDRAFYWKGTVGFDGVIDWLEFYIFGKPFWVFNIADASLVVGTIILIIVLIVDMIKEAMDNSKKKENKGLSQEEIAKIKENDKHLSSDTKVENKEDNKIDEKDHK